MKRYGPDIELLQKLLEVSKRGKTSIMEDILSQLELYDYETNADLIPYLREQLENFDYPLICDKLCQVLGQTQPMFT
jgi:hypothetical protein